MATPTHNCMDSNASTLAVLSDDFAERVRDNVEKDVDTPMIVRQARAHLCELERDPDRLRSHASTHVFHEHLDPHGILAAMLDCAPNEGGRRYVACAIIKCGSETSVLVDLANTWLRYLLLVFKGNSEAWRSVDASDHATPTLQESQIHLNSIPSSRPASFRTSVIQRDGYRCVLSGAYDLESMQEDIELQGVDLVPLEAAHIIKRAVATFDERQRLSAYSTWDIIRHYAHWSNESLTHMMDLIDTSENGIMLQYDLHAAFERFYWSLVPEKDPTGQDLPHTYRVKVFRNNAMPRSKPFRQVITFKNHDAPEQLKKELDLVPKVHPLPNPKFLSLHAALAQVLHMSGAGKMIDLYMDKSSQNGTMVPSGKVRHGDELAVLLSQIEL